MLYDPNWTTDKTVERFDKNEFVDWLGQQPADQGYSYFRGAECAVGLYFRAHGIPDSSSARLERELGVFEIVACQPHTFGAAYRRGTATSWWKRLWMKMRAPVIRTIY